ncbi:hypothetical protein Acy02nite_76000 [Actinoplanes cyaneus]|uniref:Uncharacterized protein n=1 Tax=Actinoplanes cyaneus TaxID=52696 RepID=A0A919IPG3_9ACTN|nr:hypothetical protein Acy02nite_76000 [Actinoplanes cyaneus]
MPSPTPARSAISRTGASTPETAKISFAASRNASRLRCASARTRRTGSAVLSPTLLPPPANRNKVPILPPA